MNGIFFDAYDTYIEKEPKLSQHICEQCDRVIYVYEEFYRFDDAVICEDCLYEYASQFKSTAEEPEYDYESFTDWRIKN